MADGAKHTVKIRYTRVHDGKGGSGQLQTAHVNGSDKRKLVGSSTKFKTELRTGFEFGYDSRVKANVKVKLNRDATSSTASARRLSGFRTTAKPSAAPSSPTPRRTWRRRTPHKSPAPPRVRSGAFTKASNPRSPFNRRPTSTTTSSRSSPARFKSSSTTWTDTSSKSPWRIETWRKS